jgi:ankyrin repeat protein
MAGSNSILKGLSSDYPFLRVKKMNMMNRIKFMRTLGTFGLATIGLIDKSLNLQQDETPLDRAIVKEFVGASHNDMAKVKALLDEFPTLLNAAHDWGQGDFETGLGAASHMGYKTLVQFFIDRGAQANIFTAALFGRLDILKPMLDVFPQAINAKGPHGYTLLHHAIQGEGDALEVKEYLVTLGAQETIIKLY